MATITKRGKRIGRPSGLTPETAAIIIEALQKHNYVSTACSLAGISETTFYNWLDRAESYQAKLLANTSNNIVDKEVEEDARRYIEFLSAVKRTQAGSEGALLGRIETAGSTPTLIEQRTITHTLKDGTTKTEVLERWRPADWQANAWILERTKWEKYGAHSSLDVQQAGVVFIERLQKARAARVVEGEFKELTDAIANEPVPEEIPGESLLAIPIRAKQPVSEPNEPVRRRPIFELIATAKAKQSRLGSHTVECEKPGNQATADQAAKHSAATKSEGGESC